MADTIGGRGHIKKAHHGRETRAVLLPSTDKTVAASALSTLTFFLAAFTAFLSPLSLLFLGLRAVSGDWSGAFRQAARPELDLPALICAGYVYWTAISAFLLLGFFPHAANTIKYGTFEIPWRFRRDHISHMRLDRLYRLTDKPCPWSKAPAKRDPDKMTVFVETDQGPRQTLHITRETTIEEIRHLLADRGRRSSGPIYLMGMRRRLRSWESMSQLGVLSLRHFVMPQRVRGGAVPSTVNAQGWDQCAVDANGNLKDAKDIDFGPDPGDEDPCFLHDTFLFIL
ncbi:hypothetical protein C8F01DRAFT_158039 [Mycena amicta]|nr:hypothetical protein C8F01DRAFT_158039 [Mycena amicta]